MHTKCAHKYTRGERTELLRERLGKAMTYWGHVENCATDRYARTWDISTCTSISRDFVEDCSCRELRTRTASHTMHIGRHDRPSFDFVMILSEFSINASNGRFFIQDLSTYFLRSSKYIKYLSARKNFSCTILLICAEKCRSNNFKEIISDINRMIIFIYNTSLQWTKNDDVRISHFRAPEFRSGDAYVWIDAIKSGAKYIYRNWISPEITESDLLCGMPRKALWLRAKKKERNVSVETVWAMYIGLYRVAPSPWVDRRL